MDVKNSPSNGNLHSSSETWWLDKANQNRPFHSQWLQNNMSELDKKMENILKVVEEGGDTFAERAEMYYQKRPQLIHMLQELHASYRDLASKYDLLVSRSDSTVSRVCSGTTLGLDQPDLHHSHQSESWADVYTINNQGHLINNNNNNNNCTSTKHLVTVELDREKATERSPFEDKNNSGLDLDQGEEKSHEGEKEELEGEMENDEKWNSLKIEVNKLMEDNLSYQNELIKRNDEKRDSIKRLMHENKVLKDSLHHRRGGEKMQARPRSSSSSSYSKLKKSIFGVFSC